MERHTLPIAECNSEAGTTAIIVAGSSNPTKSTNGRRHPRLDSVADVGLIARTIRANRLWILVLCHLLIFAAAHWLAFWLRFDFGLPQHMAEVFARTLPLVLGVKLTVFYFAGHYHGSWRYVTFADLAVLLRAACISLLIIIAIDRLLFPLSIPRTVLILDSVATILLLGAALSICRLFHEQFWPALHHRHCRWALLVGADHSSALLAHQIHSHSRLQYRIKGFLDTDDTKKGQRLGGIPVLGTPDQVGQIAAQYGASDVLVTAGVLAGKHLRQLMSHCDTAGLTLKIIPPVEDLFSGSRHVPVRDIEINDLLRREPVELDCRAIAELLKGRTIMVTGAGGSIGSEMCRQVLTFKPARLVLVGKGEHSIFTIDQELQRQKTNTQIVPCIGDVRDRARMRDIFESYKPEIIFHAAAHKHVPLMESNVSEAIKNNVFGTKCVADLAHETDVLGFVLISTDKAVNPTSVMGVSKQLAERYVHALSQESSTRFVAVRFGNVLGSAGSVVPIFQDQIRRGGPLTITDARMTRYFMSIPEASQLVLQAAAMGRGGEIFVLEMGEPVRIVDLAQDLIQLSGLPTDAIELAFVGLRPGEKLFEELYFGDEQTLPTSHPKLRACYHRLYLSAEVRRAMRELEGVLDRPEECIRQKLKELSPEYHVPQVDDWGESDEVTALLGSREQLLDNGRN